jgi:hypothetical protein
MPRVPGLNYGGGTRETALENRQKTEKPKKNRGRPAKNSVKAPKEPTELGKQVAEDAVALLEKLN